MSFLNTLEKNLNKSARTENNAVACSSTLDPVLDFFSKAGAMRNDISGAIALFQKAFSANPQLAIRCLFYLRDIRGGQGERTMFKQTMLKFLEQEYEK